MTDTLQLPSNPYVSINDEIVGITSGNRKYRFPLQKIMKMYVSKRKSRQIFDFLGSLLNLAHENTYNLCIQTDDGKETRIRISSLERYYFIRLISMIRKTNVNSSIVAA